MERVEFLVKIWEEERQRAMENELGFFGSVAGLAGGEKIRAVMPFREDMFWEMEEERDVIG